MLADGCREAGLFEALGAAMAQGSRGQPAAAARDGVRRRGRDDGGAEPRRHGRPAHARSCSRPPRACGCRARPHVYACSHLANSASLLLPISNLTNLLAFEASGLSFTRFAALMALPWLVALAVEWVVLGRAFARDLRPAGRAPDARRAPSASSCRGSRIGVVAATLVGFALSSLAGIAPVWIAAAGALALVVRERRPPAAIVRAIEPAFLVFVLGLAIVVRAAGDHGLQSAVDGLVPHGDGLLALLAIAAIAAVAANLLNNLPATLIVLPVAAAGGAGPVLAMLIGVNVGPNLTYVGSLATLLWRRVLHAHDHDTDIGEFVRLGALTVPPILLASTLALWLALQVV